MPEKDGHLMDLFDRYIPEPNSGCWIWEGATQKGYACVMIRPKGIFRVHRLVLEEKLGRPIQPGFHSLHNCDVKPCINPDHLYEGTHAQNMQDSWDRKTDRPNPTWLLINRLGSQHPLAKLKESDIPGIRRRMAAGESQYSIARSFGVSRSTILNIKRGTSWRKH